MFELIAMITTIDISVLNPISAMTEEVLASNIHSASACAGALAGTVSDLVFQNYNVIAEYTDGSVKLEHVSKLGEVVLSCR